MNQYDFTKRARGRDGRRAGHRLRGGASGCSQGGARVALWDRDEAALAAAKRRARAVRRRADGRSSTSRIAMPCSEATDRAPATRFGAIDVLVHSAGIAGANAPVADYAPEEWSRVIDVDLNGDLPRQPGGRRGR